MQMKILTYITTKKIFLYRCEQNKFKKSGLCSSRERPLHQEHFQLGNYASLDAKLASEETKKVQMMIHRYNHLFSGRSSVLGVSSEIENTNQIKS